MTLRLALVIDGDASGAGRALQETGTAVENLGRRAEGATGRLEGATSAIERAGPGLRVVGQEADAAAGALERTTGAADGVVDGLGKATGAADGLTGSIKGIVGAAAGFAAGLGIGLVTVLLNEAAGAAYEFARQMLDASYRIEQALSVQAGLVRDVAAAYREAQGAASSYGLNSAAVTKLELQNNRAKLQAEFDASAAKLAEGGILSTFVGGGELAPRQSVGLGSFKPGGQSVDPFAAVREAYVAGVASGAPDAIAAREEVAKIAAGLPVDSPGRREAADLLERIEETAQLQAALRQSDDAESGIDGNVEALRRLGIAPPAKPPRAGGGARRKSVATGESDLPPVPAPRPGVSAPVPTPRPEGLGARDEAEQLADALGEVRSATMDFARALIAGEPPLEALGKAALRLSDRLLESALDKAAGVAFDGLGGFLGQALGGALGGAFGGGGTGVGWNDYGAGATTGGLYHTGGIVGAGGASRLAPAALFAAAPRLHAGGVLRPGERPAILMEGEEVGWPEQLKRKYGGGGVTVHNWHVQSPNPRAFVEARATTARAGAGFAARMARHA